MSSSLQPRFERFFGQTGSNFALTTRRLRSRLSSATGERAAAEPNVVYKANGTATAEKISIFDRRFDKEIFAMALPSYTAMLLDPVATLIDVSFIGRIPAATLGLAGIGISNTILNYFSFTFFFIVVTTTTLLAQTLATAAAAQGLDAAAGARSEASKAEGSKIIANAVVVALFLGIFSAGLASLIAPKLIAMIGSSKSAEAVPYALEYFRIKCLGIPALIVFFALNGAYRGYRDLRTPVIAGAASSITKVCLSYIMLFRLGLGVGGAGLADTAAKYVSAGMLAALLIRDGRLRPADLAALPGRRRVAELCAPGGALTARKIVEQLCFTATTSLSASFGSIVVAANEIAKQCWSLASMMSWPLSIAGQTLVAGQLGEWRATKEASRLRRVRALAGRLAVLGAASGVAGSILVLAGRRAIVAAMSRSPEVAVAALSQISLVVMLLPLAALCDMMESVSVASRDYDTVLAGMVGGAAALGAVLAAGRALAAGPNTVWAGVLALFSVRVIVALRRFRRLGVAADVEEEAAAAAAAEAAAEAEAERRPGQQMAAADGPVAA